MRKKIYFLACCLLTIGFLTHPPGSFFLNFGKAPLSLDERSLEELVDMARAGQTLQSLGDLDLIGELTQNDLRPWAHFPIHDVMNIEGTALYYFHQHRLDESGHFHTFLVDKGLLTHLVGVSLSPKGEFQGLFTINQWVSAETFKPAQEIVRHLKEFHFEQNYPSKRVNEYLTALFKLFRPEIEQLLYERDKRLDQMPGSWTKILTDRNHEIISSKRLTIDEQMIRLTSALDSKRCLQR